MTFVDWVVVGAVFGIKAFFAVVVFLLCAWVVLGVLALLGSVFGGNDDLQ